MDMIKNLGLLIMLLVITILLIGYVWRGVEIDSLNSDIQSLQAAGAQKVKELEHTNAQEVVKVVERIKEIPTYITVPSTATCESAVRVLRGRVND